MNAFRVTFSSFPAKTLTMVAESSAAVNDRIGEVRLVVEQLIGAELGAVRIQHLADRDLTEGDRGAIDTASRRAGQAPASPYQLGKATEVLAHAVGGPVGADRVLSVLRAGLGGQVPAPLARAIEDGRTALDGVPAVEVLDPAERVRRAAA